MQTREDKGEKNIVHTYFGVSAVGSSKQKTYNTNVMWNCVMKLPVKENFKRSTVGHKFDKIRSK